MPRKTLSLREIRLVDDLIRFLASQNLDFRVKIKRHSRLGVFYVVYIF